jgi:hypothetical protein
MHSAREQQVVAQSEMVVAETNGFKSPGHFPRMSSFCFHGCASHGGMDSVVGIVNFVGRKDSESASKKIATRAVARHNMMTTAKKAHLTLLVLTP